MISFSDLSISFLARYMMAIEANAIIDISINDIFQFDTIVFHLSQSFLMISFAVTKAYSPMMKLPSILNIRNSLPLSFLFNLDMTVPVILIFRSLSERSSVSIRSPFFRCLNFSTLVVQSLQ